MRRERGDSESRGRERWGRDSKRGVIERGRVGERDEREGEDMARES